MKLNTQTKKVDSAGMVVNVDFSIDMNGKAFSVLSSDMYSNPIPTIVRELSSNAHDAHIAAGKSDVPFQVFTPTAFDPFFAVKDFGTGLRYYAYNATIVNEHDGESTIFIDGDIRKKIEGITMIVINEHDTVNIGALLYDNTNDQTVIRIASNFSGDSLRVEFDDTLVLYSTYFRSTKEQSNEFTGAFGLGSKTPLAYTDNFLVTNRFNGTKRVYNIMTNEVGMPQINLMMSAGTDEDNGLEVKIAVDSYQYDQFRDAIVSQLKYFDPLPEIQNDTITFPELVHKGENFLLFDSLPHLWGSGYACVGNNAYEIKHLNNELFRDNLVCRFDIGEVMVTASREDLQYDETTLEAIRNREKAALEEYTTFILDSIKGQSMTSYEKAVFLNNNCQMLDLSSPDVRQRVGDPNLRYSKQSIKIPLHGWGDYFTVKWVDSQDGTKVRSINSAHSQRRSALRWSEYNEYQKKTRRLTTPLYISPDENYTVFVRDSSYSFLKKIGYYLEHNNCPKNNVMTLDVYTDDTLAMLYEVAEDNLTFVFLSEIELPKTISTTAYGSNTTPVAKIFDATTNQFYTSKYWTDVFTPLTKIDTDAYIVKTHRGEMEDITEDDKSFLRDYLNAGMEFDSENTVILAMSRAKYEKALSYGFTPIQELIDELKSKVTIPVALVNRTELRPVYERVLSSDIVKRVKRSTVFATLGTDHPIRKLDRFRKVYERRYLTEKLDQIEKLSTAIDVKPEVSEFVPKTIDKVTKLMDNVTDRLGLLKYTSSPWYSSDKDHYSQALQEYITKMFNTGEDNE